MKQKKPTKPYPDFPLYAHSAGVWAKKIRGKLYYFGPWSDYKTALEKYLAERDFLYAGKPPPSPHGVELLELADQYMDSKLSAMESGELSRQHYLDCKRDVQMAVDVLGPRRPVRTLSLDDFRRLRGEIVKDRNATTITNIIKRLRAMFAWGKDPAKLLDDVPEYGGEFSPPPLRVRRKALRSGGPRDLKADEILAVLTAAKAGAHGQLLNLRAMTVTRCSRRNSARRSGPVAYVP